MRNGFHALFALCVMPAFATAAFAESVRISVKTREGVGVESKIWSLVGSHEKEDRTQANGEKVINGIECQPGVKFKIKPLNPFAEHKPTGWVDCAPSLSFEVTPYKLGAAVSGVLNSDGNVMAQIYAASQSSPFSVRLSTALFKFETDVDDGKIGSSAFSANELAALFRKAGDKKQAQLFSAAAIELGALSILDNATAVDPDIFTDALPNGLRVESEEANEVLKEFQEEKGLDTGKWDRRTFVKIRADDQARAEKE